MTQFAATALDNGQDVHIAGHRRLTTWNLFNLSIAMLGSQIAWTVELGYGTPFLLSLGLSEQLTSLVWLAGPISGLIAQPVIGAISDASTSRYRRRYWIVMATLVLIVSTLLLAYCQAIAAFFINRPGDVDDDKDSPMSNDARQMAIIIAVVAFYALDFALNALQASLRNLLLDVTPPEQINAGNAWHGRMLHAGNIIGFGFGFLPLAKIPVLNWLGGDQFRKFCILSIVVLLITVWITCFTQDERQRTIDPSVGVGEGSKTFQVFENIRFALVNLPKPIRRICYVQLFSWMGWFPFLFYATTYVGQVMAAEHNKEPDKDLATRKGEFAMLLYSIVAVTAGTFLPHLTRRDPRLLDHSEKDPREAALRWKAEAKRAGKPFRLPRMPFLLRSIWTMALILFGLFTLSTFFIRTVVQATIAISFLGICWAVTCWVPFALLMEFLKEIDEFRTSRAIEPTLTHPPSSSRPVTDETQPLLENRPDEEPDLLDAPPVAGGTVLGLHNLAIVLPQFIVAVVASAIFKSVDGGEESGGNTYLGRNGVAWVLRFGGLCAVFGALVTRMVPLTKNEKQMRKLLTEMRDELDMLQGEDNEHGP